MLSLAQANEKIGDLKSSATMEATCSISANQIGFGARATPLLPQSAQSEMNVKCSNTSAYTIDLAYGGIYGQGSASIEYNVVQVYSNNNITTNNVINDTGTLGQVFCQGGSNTVQFNHINLAQAYGYTKANTWMPDTKKICNGMYVRNKSLSIPGNAYTYGVMNGLSKGDKLAYSIAVPGDSTKVWNSGNNSYKSTGNGEFQVIPVIAKIVPDNSGSKYPAPDMYMDTVTAVISY